MRESSRIVSNFKIFLFCCFYLKFSPIYAQSLDQLYEKAKNYNSLIKEKKFAKEIAFERKAQARSVVFPDLSANSQSVWRQQANVGAFGEGYQHTAYLSLVQPLFQGGAEYHTWQMAKNLPEIANLDLILQEINLYTDVAISFFDYLKQQQQKTTLQEQKNTLVRRVNTLEKRAKIGRNKLTDVLAAKTHLARITADLALLESQIINSRKSLANLTGEHVFANLIDDFHLNSLKISSTWEKNLLQTPLIKAQELTLENYKREIGIASANFYPSLDVEGKYYLDRAGILKDSEWDVTLTAKWDLFSGGMDLSEKRIKSYEMQSLEAKLQEKKQTLVNDFKALKESFQAQKAVLEKMKLAVELAQQNYTEHIKEVDQGLVNQLDLLKVLEEYLQIRQAYDQQTYEMKKTWIYLRALAGVSP